MSLTDRCGCRLLLFDSDDFGMTFAGFLDLYRMPDMDIAHDCYVQRLSHGRNIADMPTHLHQVSGLPEFHQADMESYE